jgi:hypothetical protein
MGVGAMTRLPESEFELETLVTAPHELATNAAKYGGSPCR